jgi:hypothetical protein
LKTLMGDSRSSEPEKTLPGQQFTSAQSIRELAAHRRGSKYDRADGLVRAMCPFNLQIFEHFQKR